MTSSEVLLVGNRTFAASGAYANVRMMPALPVLVVCCLDPRLDPAYIAGQRLGDAPIIRNVGGRVTDEVIADIAFIAQLASRAVADGPLFEIAVVHHTDCGAARFADNAFRKSLADRSALTKRL